MKKIITIACLATIVSATSGTAMADSIKGKLGVTGKIGIMVPADNNADLNDNKTDAGLIGGAGLIYGIDDHIAVEVDLSHAAFGSDGGDFGVTNLSFGGQYRFALADHRLVPYVGAGLDVIFSDFEANNGTNLDVDTTVGVHVSGGVDYFIQKQLALTAEGKLVVAPDTDIEGNRGDFDPTSFSTTVGIRYFFN